MSVADTITINGTLYKVVREADNPDAVTLGQLCKKFLANKQRRSDAGEITPRMVVDYSYTCANLIKAIGANRKITSIRPEDFDKLLADYAADKSIYSVANLVQRTRTLFKFAFDSYLIDKPVRFGVEFKKPPKRMFRKKRVERGPRMFTAEQIRAILDMANPAIKAMTLLGINCGFGNHDCSKLTFGAIDFATGWIDFPRPKTYVGRRIPIWPETVEAIEAYLPHRQRPKKKAHRELIFITIHGSPWYRDNGSCSQPITSQFRKYLERLGIYRKGVSFYTLRHVFETVAGECKDQVAVNAVMGHVDESMAATYRESISDERLRDATDFVRRWLFPEKFAQEQGRATT
jgi:integrase